MHLNHAQAAALHQTGILNRVQATVRTTLPPTPITMHLACDSTPPQASILLVLAVSVLSMQPVRLMAMLRVLPMEIRCSGTLTLQLLQVITQTMEVEMAVLPPILPFSLRRFTMPLQATHSLLKVRTAPMHPQAVIRRTRQTHTLPLPLVTSVSQKAQHLAFLPVRTLTAQRRRVRLA